MMNSINLIREVNGNAVVRDIGDDRISVDLAKPSSMMEILGDQELVILAKDADDRLQIVLEIV